MTIVPSGLSLDPELSWNTATWPAAAATIKPPGPSAGCWGWSLHSCWVGPPGSRPGWLFWLVGCGSHRISTPSAAPANVGAG
ncbi:hypothetical protein SynMINOS11_02615 [Synechococcus sp. Minos11]|nr:hypothetical protein SynMINOS11_02615 [Synechococcus sp. Minos11]